MNSYFPNPFLLQEGQSAGGMCNFSGISSGISSRYESQGQFLCGSGNQTMSGQYGSGSPTGHPSSGHMTGPGELPANCRPSDLNGYDGHHHVNSGWSTPAAAGAQQPDFNHGGPSTNCSGDVNSPVSHNYNSPAQQSVPFYPWMGVVGRYSLLFHCLHVLYVRLFRVHATLPIGVVIAFRGR